MSSLPETKLSAKVDGLALSVLKMWDRMSSAVPDWGKRMGNHVSKYFQAAFLFSSSTILGKDRNSAALNSSTSLAEVLVFPLCWS